MVALALLAAGALGGCAARTGTSGAPPEPERVAAAVESTQPHARLHVTFDWSLQDREGRFSGRGVVRIEPPYRARLDLYGPRGEGYLIAVLEGEELRLRGVAPPGLLPPPAFLWATLGVFRAPQAQLLATDRSDGALALTFAADRERWRFRFEDERLRHVEWDGPDGGRQTVELQGVAEFGLPRRGAYRDWLAFRELVLSLTSVEQVDAFDPEIWNVDSR